MLPLCRQLIGALKTDIVVGLFALEGKASSSSQQSIQQSQLSIVAACGLSVVMYVFIYLVFAKQRVKY